MSLSNPADAKILIVSASDSRFMPFLRGMMASMQGWLAKLHVQMACFDLGLTDEDRAWLRAQGCTVATPRAHLGVREEDHSAALRSFLARPFLPEYFPGHDVYVWVDSDVWLQDEAVLSEYVAGACAEGMAVTHERTSDYRLQLWLLAWTAKHMALGYGAATTTHLMRRPHLNAGFFAIHANAPHWEAWARRYEAAIKRTGALVPHDQFSLNHAIYGDLFGEKDMLDTKSLDPRCNWICDRGIPMWNDAAGAFCKPSAPFEPIGAMHLAGPAKRTRYTIARSSGGSFLTYLLQGASPTNPVTSGPLDAPPAIREAA
jgi:hypothetical protein